MTTTLDNWDQGHLTKEESEDMRELAATLEMLTTRLRDEVNGFQPKTIRAHVVVDDKGLRFRLLGGMDESDVILGANLQVGDEVTLTVTK